MTANKTPPLSASVSERGGSFMPTPFGRFLSYTVSQTDFSKDLLQPWTGNPLGTPTVRMTKRPSGPTGFPPSAFWNPIFY